MDNIQVKVNCYPFIMGSVIVQRPPFRIAAESLEMLLRTSYPFGARYRLRQRAPARNDTADRLEISKYPRFNFFYGHHNATVVHTRWPNDLPHDRFSQLLRILAV